MIVQCIPHETIPAISKRLSLRSTISGPPESPLNKRKWMKKAIEQTNSDISMKHTWQESSSPSKYPAHIIFSVIIPVAKFVPRTQSKFVIIGTLTSRNLHVDSPCSVVVPHPATIAFVPA